MYAGLRSLNPSLDDAVLTDRFGRMLGIATGAAVFSTLSGVYVSFFLNASTGACIVLVQALLFVVAVLFAPKHGLLSRDRAISLS